MFYKQKPYDQEPTRPNVLTSHADLNHLLDTLLSRIHLILGDNLTGLYLYGSLVTGDFDHDISDIDLLAITSSDLTPDELDRLHRMHDQIAAEYKQWDNRYHLIPKLNYYPN